MVGGIALRVVYIMLNIPIDVCVYIHASRDNSQTLRC